MCILFSDLRHYTLNIKVICTFCPITPVLKTLIWISNTILKSTLIFGLMHAKINFLYTLIFNSWGRHLDWYSFFILIRSTAISQHDRIFRVRLSWKGIHLDLCIFKTKRNKHELCFFKRNASTKCVGIGYVNGVCRIDSYISKYTYKCLSENIYSLTIPADNMIKDEQNSQWHCESIVNSSYRSSSILLKVASKLNLKLSKHLLCFKNPKWRFILFYLMIYWLIYFNQNTNEY